MSEYVSLAAFLYEENLARLVLVSVFYAKRQATSLFNKILDTLLHAKNVMPPYDYICDVLMVPILAL